MNRNAYMLKLHGILLHRRASLRRSINEELGLLVHNDDEDEAHEDDVVSQVAEAEDHELAAIDNALMRIRDGVFGRCEGCDRNIPLARLEALPYATHCIDCQRDSEH